MRKAGHPTWQSAADGETTTHGGIPQADLHAAGNSKLQPENACRHGAHESGHFISGCARIASLRANGPGSAHASAGLSVDERNRFLAPQSRSERQQFSFVEHYSPAASADLERGLAHLLRAEYEHAERQFKDLYWSPQWAQALDIRAEAAAYMAWVDFERGYPEACENWITAAIRLVQRHFGATLPEILNSMKHGSHSAVSSPTENAILVLWSALHIRSKLLVERIVYRGEIRLQEKARETFNYLQAFDGCLGHPLIIGHNQRWLAVFLAAKIDSDNKEIKRSLAKSYEMFPRAGLEDAYLTRDKGVVYWQSGQLVQARNHLEMGLSGLAHFDDLRAMGPALCALGRVTQQMLGPAERARRYALAGGAIHPYFFVIRIAQNEYESVSHKGRQKDMDDLLSGAYPFREVKAVMERIHGSESKAIEKIKENLR